MFHSRGLNNKINRIHERALTITFDDKSSTFQELLDNHRNVGTLATEIYKVLHGYSPALINEVFVPSHCKYNLQ